MENDNLNGTQFFVWYIAVDVLIFEYTEQKKTNWQYIWPQCNVIKFTLLFVCGMWMLNYTQYLHLIQK